MGFPGVSRKRHMSYSLHEFMGLPRLLWACLCLPGGSVLPGKFIWYHQFSCVPERICGLMGCSWVTEEQRMSWVVHGGVMDLSGFAWGFVGYPGFRLNTLSEVSRSFTWTPLENYICCHGFQRISCSCLELPWVAWGFTRFPVLNWVSLCLLCLSTVSYVHKYFYVLSWVNSGKKIESSHGFAWGCMCLSGLSWARTPCDDENERELCTSSLDNGLF